MNRFIIAAAAAITSLTSVAQEQPPIPAPMPLPLPLPTPGTAAPKPGAAVGKVVVKPEAARISGYRSAEDTADSASAKANTAPVEEGVAMESGGTGLIFGFANAEGVPASEVFGAVLPDPANPFDNSPPPKEEEPKDELTSKKDSDPKAVGDKANEKKKPEKPEEKSK